MKLNIIATFNFDLCCYKNECQWSKMLSITLDHKAKGFKCAILLDAILRLNTTDTNANGLT